MYKSLILLSAIIIGTISCAHLQVPVAIEPVLSTPGPLYTLEPEPPILIKPSPSTSPNVRAPILVFPVTVPVQKQKTIFINILESDKYPEWDQAISESVLKWNLALGLEKFSLEEGDIKIDVLFVDQASSTELNAVGTYRRKSHDCEGQEIWLYKSAKKTKMTAIMLHELGHSMGLSHSEYENDIMYPTVRIIPELSENDIARAKEIKRECE